MTWLCASCAAESDVQLAWCPACGADHTYWPAVRRPHAYAVPDTARTTARDLWGSSVRWRQLPADLARAVGRLPETPWIMAVYGPPGAGKSTLLLRLADAYTAWGAVVYDSLEEGASPSLAEKLRRLEILSDSLVVVVRNDLPALVECVREERATLVVLDSLTWSPLRAEDVTRLARETGASVAYSLHATKAGDARGALSLTHAADVVVRVEAGGATALEKTRFGPAVVADSDTTPEVPNGV